MSATSVSLQTEELSEELHIFAISEEGTDTEQQPNEQETLYFPIAQRDPNDVRTILRLAVCALGFAVLSLALAALLTYKLTRTPALVVVERTSEGDRVVGDDRQYTLTGPVQIRPDGPSDGDKKYAAAKWAETFFQIDPQTRRADIVRGLKMMTPDAAVALVDGVKQSGEWETQRREEWQAVWKAQVISVSRDDPYKVEIVGQQQINKTLGGAVHHTTRQLMFTLALRADTAKRTEDNQNTGFRIAGIVDMKTLEPTTASTSTVAGNPPVISVAPPQPAQ